MATALRRKCVCGHADWRHKSEIGDLTYCRSCDCDRWQDSAPAEAPNGQGGDATDEITALRAELARVTKKLDEAKCELRITVEMDSKLEEECGDWCERAGKAERELAALKQQNAALKAENAELRADEGRLNKTITTICDAAEGMWGYGTDLRNGTHAMLLRAAIDAAREGGNG